MDPITTAIIATLPALASDLVKSSVRDAYDGLKSVIRRKWGATSPIAKSIDAMETKHDSEHEATVLAQNVATANATADADVMKALAKLVDELKKAGISSEAGANISTEIGGDAKGIIGSHNVSVGSMSFDSKS